MKDLCTVLIIEDNPDDFLLLREIFDSTDQRPQADATLVLEGRCPSPGNTPLNVP